ATATITRGTGGIAPITNTVIKSSKAFNVCERQQQGPIETDLEPSRISSDNHGGQPRVLYLPPESCPYVLVITNVPRLRSNSLETYIELKNKLTHWLHVNANFVFC
ncbi:hypothetical protein NDU88_002498, partial [Pleurodeles waltl]